MEIAISILTMMSAILAFVNTKGRLKWVVTLSQFGCIVGVCVCSILAIGNANEEKAALNAEISGLRGYIDSQNKSIEFAKSIIRIPKEKLQDVERCIEERMAVLLDVHYGDKSYDAENEFLSYVFTDSTRTKFKGAFLLDRERIECLLRNGCSNDSVRVAFEGIMRASISDSCKGDQRAMFNCVSRIINIFVRTIRSGYDGKGYSYIVLQKNEGLRIALTTAQVKEIVSMPEYPASLQIYNILVGQGLEVLKLRKDKPNLVEYAANFPEPAPDGDKPTTQVK